MIKSNRSFIIKLILVILWLGVIFFLSSANSADTNNQGAGVTKIIVTNTIKVTNYVHITNIELNDENLDKIIKDIHPVIRKLAHFGEFFILAILVLLMIRETNIKYYYSFTILFCIIMAIFDETHQLFVEGRSGNLFDVIIDTTGCLSYIIINKIYNIIKIKKVK